MRVTYRLNKGSLAFHKGESLKAAAATAEKSGASGKTRLRLGRIVTAICCYTISRLILWDGCQEFSLYHHDLHLTSGWRCGEAWS